MNQALSIKSYLLAVGTVAVLAGGAVGLSALFANASAGPAVGVTVTNASNSVVTSAPIGSNVFVGASVASSTGSTTPTGTFTFNSFANQTCTGTATVQSGVALVNGVASSSANTMGAAGLSFIVNYNGDATNTPSVSSCTVVTPTSAAVTVTNALSTTSAMVGSSVTSQATLGGNTSNASGTVAYNVYSNNICTTAVATSAPVTVTNGVVPASAAINFNQAGTYFWQAVYSGDTNNSAATSSCGALTINAVATTTTPVPPPVIHRGDGDNDDNHGIASTTINGHHDNDNDGQGEDHEGFHFPNLNANFHAFLGSLNGKHKGEDKNDNKINASTTIQVKGEGHGNNHGQDNDQDDN